MDRDEPKEDERKLAGRVVKIGVFIFSLVLLGILVAAWLIGDQGNLPFDYDGFD